MKAGGRFEVGVLYGLYCLEHGESLDLGKGWGYVEKRTSPGTPETVERIRVMLEEEWPERGPNETWMDERILAMISAFVKRHQNCKLRVWNDADSRYQKLLVIMYEDPDWLEFYVWDDVSLSERSLPAGQERFERHIRNLRSRLSLLETKLAEGRVMWFRVKSTKRMIEWLRKAIPKQIEENAREMKQALERRERQVDRRPRRDVLEDIKGKPISLYPRGLRTSKKRFLKKNY